MITGIIIIINYITSWGLIINLWPSFMKNWSNTSVIIIPQRIYLPVLVNLENHERSNSFYDNSIISHKVLEKNSGIIMTFPVIDQKMRLVDGSTTSSIYVTVMNDEEYHFLLSSYCLNKFFLNSFSRYLCIIQI